MKKTKSVNFVQKILITVKLVAKITVKLVRVDLVSTNKKRNVIVQMTEIWMRQQEHVKRKQD